MNHTCSYTKGRKTATYSMNLKSTTMFPLCTKEFSGSNHCRVVESKGGAFCWQSNNCVLSSSNLFQRLASKFCLSALRFSAWRSRWAKTKLASRDLSLIAFGAKLKQM